MNNTSYVTLWLTTNKLLKTFNKTASTPPKMEAQPSFEQQPLPDIGLPKTATELEQLISDRLTDAFA